MIPTVEVRWFFRGTIPAAVRDWFIDDSVPPVEQPPRTDYYLRLPQNDALGVKWREGQIEAKRRDRHFGAAHFGAQAVGEVELWRKWSFPLAVETALENVRASDAWVGVRKARWLRGYRWDGEKTTAVSPDDPASICHLELTQLTVQTASWWTIGFESYGEEVAYRTQLLPVTQKIMETDPPLTLSRTASFAYPRWLLKIAAA